jgi:hypothetical protein
MAENFDNIEKEIIKELDDFFIEVVEKQYKGNRIWTNRIKEKIGDLGVKLGHNVAIGGFINKFEREWLYDVVWYNEDSEKRLTRIPLIVESEWDRNYLGIKYDFEKLLVGNAEKRLMICQARTNEIPELFEKLKRAINTFEENYGDRFLIAILDSQTESEFHYKTFVKSKNPVIE